jgi:hypothetical protein
LHFLRGRLSNFFLLQWIILIRPSQKKGKKKTRLKAPQNKILSWKMECLLYGPCVICEWGKLWAKHMG